MTAGGRVENAVESIQVAANTGKIGDGKISIASVESATRIRIGESGEDALYTLPPFKPRLHCVMYFVLIYSAQITPSKKCGIL